MAIVHDFHIIVHSANPSYEGTLADQLSPWLVQVSPHKNSDVLPTATCSEHHLHDDLLPNHRGSSPVGAGRDWET
jgi:hypothetical protein